MKKIIIATGGTGGHIFPAEAFCEQLLDLGHTPELVIDERGEKFLSGALGKIPKHKIKSYPPSSGVTAKLLNILYLIFSALILITKFMKNKPDQIYGFGGYPSVPAIIAGIVLRIPITLHEQNAVLGRVNRVFFPFIKRLTVTLQNVKYVNYESRKVVIVQNPIRKNLNEAKLKNKDQFTILVLGGSQGAGIFSEVLPSVISNLKIDNLNVYHQARAELIDTTKLNYFGEINYVVKDFFNNMPELYQNADLVISRSGASTLTEIMHFKIPSLLIPYPHAADNHQLYNAKYLEDLGVACVIKQSDFNQVLVEEKLSFLVQNIENIKSIYSSISKLSEIRLIDTVDLA